MEERQVYDVAVRDQGTLADDTLIAIAKTAEARIDAVVKIKQLALKVTNAGDWTDQGGKPYCLVSGAEKIANLFNVSWSFMTPEPIYEQDEDGHYTYTFQGRFSMGGRSIEVEGSRSSKDKFFSQNDYVNNEKIPRSVGDRDNKRDVKMAALTNLLGNGITRLLGIRNLSWADLAEYAGITKEMCGKVEYKKSDKPPLKEPAKKAAEPAAEVQTKTTYIKGVESKEGINEKTKKPYTIHGITDEDGTIYKTFDTVFKALAESAAYNATICKLNFTTSKFGNTLTAMEVEQGPDDVPDYRPED